MSKIVKKKDLDVLIESTLIEAGIISEDKSEKNLYSTGMFGTPEEADAWEQEFKNRDKKEKEEKEKKEEKEDEMSMKESTSEKPLMNESLQREIERFNKLSNYTFKK